MVIFPEMTACRFGDIRQGSLFLFLWGAAERNAWCIKVAHDPSGDSPGEFFVVLDREAWGPDGVPCLVSWSDPDQTVFKLGGSFVFRADVDPNSIDLNPDIDPDTNLGFLVAGNENFLRVVTLPDGVGRQRTFWIQLPSGQVHQVAPELRNRPRALVERWEIILLPSQDMAVEPISIFKWAPEQG